MTNADPKRCASCGSSNIYFDLAYGWSCFDCGRTDADE